MDENNDYKKAKIERVTRWSTVWIIPIVTVLIALWIVFYYVSHRGPEITLVTVNAEGIEAGKTAIKSRSVDVGRVETVTLSDDLSQVVIKARLNDGMENLLRHDSIFWVVKPKVGAEGITGLGTLLSGAYIELQPGNSKEKEDRFYLLDSPPQASPDAKGVRILLHSKRSGTVNIGDPVLFRGLRVGTVESSGFDPQKRLMNYRLFIFHPYEKLVTTNVRFWIDSGVAFNMSSEGIRVEMGSITTLLSGGISFDVPAGWELGDKAHNNAEYVLYRNEKDIQNSLYTKHQDLLLFFKDSVRGLQPGASVEFKGIRLGTVLDVPYYVTSFNQFATLDYSIPVRIRIEPERLNKTLIKEVNVVKNLLDARDKGMRASLKSANLLTGNLFIDLDFHSNATPWHGPRVIDGLEVVPTVSNELSQIQQKVANMLDKINKLPVEKTVAEMNETLANVKQVMSSLNKILASQEMQTLPKSMQNSLTELNKSLKALQPGSSSYNQSVESLKQLEQTLREIQPILKTLNDKSNALIIDAKPGKDPQPKRAK